jgi:Glycosyltransferase family 87
MVSLDWIQSRSFYLTLFIGVSVTFLALAVVGFRYSTHRLSDFAGYYGASRMLVSGDNPADFYRDSWFKKRLAGLGIDEPTIIYYVNPPAGTLIAVPLVWLGPFTAKILWNGFSICALFLAFGLFRNAIGIPPQSVHNLVLFGTIFCTVPFLHNLERGQVYPLLLVFVVLLYKGYSDNNSIMTAFSLSILLFLKYFGWMFLILFVLEKRWKDVRYVGVVLTVGLVVLIAAFGPVTYEEHFRRLTEAFASHDFAVTGLPSVPALFGALFVKDAAWNLAPVVNAPWLAALLDALSLTVMLALTFRFTRSVTRFMCVLVVSVIFTPLAADHHYVLLALPLFLLFLPGQRNGDGPRVSLAALCTAYVVCGWLPTMNISKFAGFGKLMCFLRLYGAVSLLILLWVQSRRQGREVSV